MRKHANLAEIIGGKRKISMSQLSNSLSSSNLSLSNFNSQSILHKRSKSKGYSFGSSPRNNLNVLSTISPTAKYHIKGIVEINLCKNKGPSFGVGRESSVEKTPLSYINNNCNPGPASYNPPTKIFKTSSSIKIGTRNNETLNIEFLNDKAINETPGPGAYKHKVIKIKGGKMTTKAKRFENLDKQNRPGPGTYNESDFDYVSKGNSRISTKLITLH